MLFTKRIRGLENLFMLLQLSSKWLMKCHSRSQTENDWLDFLRPTSWAKNLTSQPLKDLRGWWQFFLQISLCSSTLPHPPPPLEHTFPMISTKIQYKICLVPQLILLSSWAILGKAMDRWGELLGYIASSAQYSLKTVTLLSQASSLLSFAALSLSPNP